MNRVVYKKSRLVQGVGINDADYVVQPVVLIDGEKKRVWCQYYRQWADMLARCYSVKVHKARNSYRGCSVVTEWHSFMNFKAWMHCQDWEGLSLDKDLLVYGNKVYGPSTCIFVTPRVNGVLSTRVSTRGDLPLGVSYKKQNKSFDAKVNRFCVEKGRSVTLHLGYFKCPEKAHEAYRIAKSKIFKDLACSQKDPRVSEALLMRSSLYEDISICLK